MTLKHVLEYSGYEIVISVDYCHRTKRVEKLNYAGVQKGFYFLDIGDFIEDKCSDIIDRIAWDEIYAAKKDEETIPVEND